jgi:hypothetical protein
MPVTDESKSISLDELLNEKIGTEAARMFSKDLQQRNQSSGFVKGMNTNLFDFLFFMSIIS